MLKTFLLVPVISLAVGIVSTLVGIAILGPTEEEALFLIPFLIVMMFVIGTIGGLVIFLKGR